MFDYQTRSVFLYFYFFVYLFTDLTVDRMKEVHNVAPEERSRD